MTDNVQDIQNKMETRAQAVLNAMANHEFRNAIVHFDTNMTSLLPGNKLEEMWNTITDKAGPFVKLISAHVADGKPIVLLDCKFEQRNLELYVTFDESTNVSGLHLGPELAPAAVEAASPPRPKAPAEESATP